MKILFADDDEGMRTLVEHIFKENGYEYICAKDGEEALELFEREHPDMVLLDVVMPKLDGYEVCGRLRTMGQTVPIIMLTAKGDIVDKSVGFKMGADDYLVKPFVSQELLLRMEAHLRRHKSDLAFAKAIPREGSNATGDIEVCFNQYEVRLRGQKVDLTAKEFEILALLAASPGQVFTRAQIYEHIWGGESDVDESSITVFIRKIREKIEDNPSQPKYLLTVWRVGYKFAERV